MILKTTSVQIRTLAIVSVFLLGGCATPHDYPLGSVVSAEQLEHTQAFKDVQAMAWPQDKWWQRYQDSQLNALIAEALQDSPTLQIADARLKQAGGIARQIGAVKQVQAGVGATVSETRVSKGYQMPPYLVPDGWNDYGTLTTNFSYDLDFWGKNSATVAAASSDYAASQAENATAHLMIAVSVANAYVELARLYADQSAVANSVKIRAKTAKLLQKRFDNGLETKGSVSQAKAIAAGVEAELLAVNESIALQKNLLAGLLGKGPDRGLTITKPTLSLSQSFGLPSDVGVGIVGRRADITAARWRSQAAAARIGVAKAEFYPNVKLSGFLGLQAFGLDNLLKTDNHAGSVGAAIYLPIFAKDRLEGGLTAAEGDYEAAVASYNATLTNAFKEVADAVTSTKALDGQIAKVKQAVSAAQEAYRIINNRYQGGLATYLNVLSAEDALIANKRRLVNLQSRAYFLDLALVHALGGGYHFPNNSDATAKANNQANNTQ